MREVGAKSKRLRVPLSPERKLGKTDRTGTIKENPPKIINAFVILAIYRGYVSRVRPVLLRTREMSYGTIPFFHFFIDSIYETKRRFRSRRVNVIEGRGFVSSSLVFLSLLTTRPVCNFSSRIGRTGKSNKTGKIYFASLHPVAKRLVNLCKVNGTGG